MKCIDLTGRKFDMLTVKESTTPGCWRCVCDCGGEKIIAGSSLRSGNTKSCGCLVHQNSGRPAIKKPLRPDPFIQLVPFVDENAEHITAIRAYLKDYGVRVKSDGFFYVSGVAYGPYASPIHAFAAALSQCIKVPT